MAIGPDDFLWKPEGENSGNAVVVTPRSYYGGTQSIDLVDSSGNVIESGQFRNQYEATGGGAWNFSKPGGSYGSDTQIRVTFDDGSQVYHPGGGGRVVSRAGGSPDFLEGEQLAGSNVAYSPDGRPFVVPGGVDFSSIAAPQINFGSAWGFAEGVGEDNKNKFYENLVDPRSIDSALSFVDTDVKGILNAANTLTPYVRDQGNQDTATNISRAGSIDQFNYSRIPGFNKFNRAELNDANEFNRSEREESIAASGLNYRNRINDVIETLEGQAKGDLPSPLLDKLQTVTSRDRGADLASAAGLGGATERSRSIQDKMDVSTRMQLALNAQAQIPNVLTQGQAVLQPPEERAPTVYNQPTQVPLNPSNIADRLPVTSNISAGQAQQQVGSAATNYQVIPATTALGANIDAQKFNANGQFMRDQFVLTGQQSQITARDSAVQGALNQDLASRQFEAGLDQRRESELIRAGTSLVGSVLGPILSAPTGSNPIIDGIRTGVSNVGGMVSDGMGVVLDAASAGADALFGDGDGVITVGNVPINSESFGNMMGSVGEFFTGPRGTPQIASAGQLASNAANISGGADQVKSNVFRDVMQPVDNPAIDARVLGQAGNAVMNWPRMGADQRINSVSQIATDVLENKGVVSSTQANAIRHSSNAIATLANPNTTDGQRAAVIASAIGNSLSYQYSGPIDNPTSIGNAAVTGRITMPNGQPGFQLSDGSTVAQSTLVNSDNAISALNAFGVLTSGASRTDKAAALTALGVDAATTNEIIGQVEGGNILAGLQIFNTVANWDEMNPIQQGAAVIQTSSSIFSAIDSTINAGVNAGSSALTYLPAATSGAAGVVSSSAAAAGSQMAGNAVAASVAPTLSATIGSYLVGAGAGVGIVLGVTQAADTIDAISDMNRSHAVGAGTLGGASSGLATGAGIGTFLGSPVLGGLIGLGVGTAAGFIAGSTASGKPSGQMARDSWREGLKEIGFVDKEYNVQLADGSTYNLGADGNSKLVNTDGTERNTFDVDWGNKDAVASIPEAHLFAIVSGLDPTSSGEFDLFHRAVSQGLNAASSNATSAEGIRDNFKAMMKGVDPRLAAARIETLRVTNKITDQEYGVYLNKLNRMFGTKITPTDREKARESMVRMIRRSGEGASKQDKELLSVLINDEKLNKNKRELQRRIDKDTRNI